MSDDIYSRLDLLEHPIGHDMAQLQFEEICKWTYFAEKIVCRKSAEKSASRKSAE